MTDTLRVFVPGVARPKGSTRAFMHGDKPVITSDNAKLKGWSKDIGYVVRAAAGEQGWVQPYGGPMEVALEFVLPMPKRPKDLEHITKPDLDKLIRGVLDPMTGVVYVDDARITRLTALKRYQLNGDALGVHIMARKAR